MTDSTQRPLSWRRILFRRGVLPLVGVAVLSIAVLGLFLQSGPFADTLTDNSRAACRARPIIAIDRSGSDLKATKGATPPDTAQLQIVSLDNAYRPKPLRPNQAVTVELEIDRSSSANVPADVRLPTLTVPVPNGATSAMTGLFTPGSPVTPDSDKYLVVKVKPGDGYRVIGNTGSSQYVNSVTITVHPATTTVSVTITSPTKDQVFTAHGNPPEAAMTYTVEATAINGHLKRVSLSVYNISLQQEVYYVESTNQFTARGTPLGVGDYTATAMATATASTGGDQWATAVVYFRVVASTSPPPVSWRSGATKVLTALGSLVHGALASFTVHAAGADCGTLTVKVVKPAANGQYVPVPAIRVQIRGVLAGGGYTVWSIFGTTDSKGVITNSRDNGTYDLRVFVPASSPTAGDVYGEIKRIELSNNNSPVEVTLTFSLTQYIVGTIVKGTENTGQEKLVYGVPFYYLAVDDQGNPFPGGEPEKMGQTGPKDDPLSWGRIAVLPGVRYKIRLSNERKPYLGEDGKNYIVEQVDVTGHILPALDSGTRVVHFTLIPDALKKYEVRVHVGATRALNVCHAPVTLTPKADLPLVQNQKQGITNFLGIYDFKDVAAGTYIVTASPPPMSDSACFISGLAPAPSVEVVLDNASPPQTRVDMSLPPNTRPLPK